MHRLLLIVVCALVARIDTQFVLYPSFARVHSAIMGLPSWEYGNADDLHSPRNDNRGNGVQYGGAEGRGSPSAKGIDVAEGRQADDLLGTVGGEVNFNSFPNPFVAFRKESYPQRSRTVVVPPVCVACKCLNGFKSCADAGGRMWVSGACVVVAAIGVDCSFPAPTSLSACDSTCVRSCVATAAAAPLLTGCTPLDAANKKQCTTPCENLSRGTTVKCNSAYPDVISAVPSPCYSHHNHHRYRRAANNSLPAIEAKSETPEIQSSYESSSDRSGRVIKINPFPINPRVNVNPVTSFVRGHVTATYVAADGVCLPGDFASAPLCP